MRIAPVSLDRDCGGETRNDLVDKAARQIYGGCKKMEIFGTRDFDGAELLQVRGDPLRVEQDEASAREDVPPARAAPSWKHPGT